MEKIYKERLTCRLCGSSIKEALQLGDIYLNDFVAEGQEIVSAPLTLARCPNCELVQLKHTPNLDRLYRQYWYKSSLNKSMIAALQDVVDNIERRVDLKDEDVVIDIGCNDGTMLGQYRNTELFKIGFDPALNLKNEATKHCNIFHNAYFGDPDIKTPMAKVITSIAMFYDLEDPHTFIELVKRSLLPEGIWVVQFTDLMSMMKANAFDNICHEHLEYYSLKVIRQLFERHGLEVFDVSTNNVNGGSIRMYIGWKQQHTVQNTVDELFYQETDYMNSFEDPLRAFSHRVEEIKKKVVTFIREQNEQGKIVAAMGASTKGNSLLQYFGLTSKDIAFAAEVNSDKFGKKTVSTNIPIISEEEAMVKQPDFFLVLPWHFRDGLIRKHKAYLDKGGHFIFPMPEVETI